MYMGEHDALDFRIAQDLKLTLGQVRALPCAEVVEWACYYEVTAELEKLHS